MKLSRALPALLILTLAACGGSPAAIASPSIANGHSAAPQSSASAATGGGAQADCAPLKTAAQQMTMLQLMVQIRTPESVEPVRSKLIGNLDLPTLLAALHTLHALDAHPSPLGDPKAAIDFYEAAATAAQVLFATNPVSQAAIDTYLLKIGTITDFLGHEGAIAGALSAAGC